MPYYAQKQRNKDQLSNFIDEKSKLVILALKIYSRIGKLKLKDLEKEGVTAHKIRSNFGNFQTLLKTCGLSTKLRKANMSDHELQNYFTEIKIVDDKCASCPSKAKKGVCFPVCSCWMTLKYRINRDGRQSIGYKGKLMSLPRLSYQLFKGPLLTDKEVSHLCDNKLCFNPDHLAMQTHQENVNGSIRRGNSLDSDERKNIFKKSRKKHNIQNMYDFQQVIAWLKQMVTITSKNEWLYNGNIPSTGYPTICFGQQNYVLSRLILANKLGINYDEIKITRHVLPDGSEAQKHDLNPEHLQHGTESDNRNDTRNRWSLSEADVSFIRKELQSKSFNKKGDSGIFDKEMAQKFGVAISTITDVRLGRAYCIYPGAIVSNGTTTRPVIQINKKGIVIGRYESITSAAKTTEIDGSSITKTCRGKAKTAGGFIWKYADQQ